MASLLSDPRGRRPDFVGAFALLVACGMRWPIPY